MANVVSSSVVLYFCPESSGRYCKSSDTDPQNAYFYAIILCPRSGPCFRKLSARRRGVEACRPRVASGPGRQPVGDRRPGRDVPGRDRRRFAARLPARDTRLRAGLRATPLLAASGRRADEKRRPLRVVRREGDRNRRRPDHARADRPLRAADAPDRPDTPCGDRCDEAVAEGLSAPGRFSDAFA